ncbi:hypothetical protein [Prevotella sp. CAG:592]|uniref:hypothetical protein n=1 Tax=Prevotella sp. CAG:592 TaxID=1262931 RepID=UPI002586E882|nr:hypothetical protein [Prevotella sp. CAG:592]
MLFLDLKQEIGKILLLSDNPQNKEVLSEAQWMKAFGLYLSRSNPSLNPNRSLGLAWILFFRRVDFVWLLMSNSGLLRIKNKQKAPYKKQKTASSYEIPY